MEKEVVKQPEQPLGIVRSVRVSNLVEEDSRGEKSYRTVYGVGELQSLFIDTEIFNKKFGESAWKGILTVRLFRMNGQKAQCIAEKSSSVDFEQTDSLVVYSEVLEQKDLSMQQWEEGVYRVLTDIDGRAGQSDDIYIIPGSGCPEEYFRLLHAGLDRNCEESEAEAHQRPHSFHTFNAEGLKNVRFFLMAQNLLGQEWVYEFVIRVMGRDGRMKALQVAKAANYMKDPAGNSILCFGIDLGNQDEFTRAGEYSVLVSCFGQLVMRLEFEISNQDVPYDFEQEVWADGGLPAVRRAAVPVYSAKDKEDIMDRLYRLVGLRKVKEEITQIMDYAEFVRLRRENGFTDRFPVAHLIFTGYPGCGKRTVAGMLGELYHALGLLEQGDLHCYKRDDFVRNGVAVEEQLVRQAIKSSQGGVMYIEEAGDLFQPENPNDRGVIALGILFGILSRENPAVMVILADVEEEMTMMLEALPDLQKLFLRQLHFDAYSPEELMEITRNKLEKLQYRFSPAAEEKFFKQLQENYLANGIETVNAHYIDGKLEEVTMRMSKRLMANRNGDYKKEDLMLITDEDIVETKEGDLEKPMQKLNEMVGLGQLKQNIVQHLNYVYFIRERQKQGFGDVLPPLNMIFSGNPGTGKMTVAKMMGEIYQSVGILTRSNVLAQDARSLSGEGGITAQQAVGVLLNMAAGGILYIDHADVLLLTDFGMNFIETLLTALSPEECGGTLVILGGYPERMEKILELTPSLKNYFPAFFHFNDYQPEELMEIADNKLKEKKYVFHPKAKELFEELVRKAYEKRDKNFGNALLIEKIVEAAIRNMSERTMKIRQERELTRQEITTIRKDDIPVGIFEMPKFERDVFDEKEIETALANLDQLVGQNSIKKQIRDFVELARHYSREGVKLSSRMSLQWCFTGNSAMGKGTVARIIASLYKAMGIINRGQVLDFKVERMIGLMEDEAQRSIGEALIRSNGGILLFDEDSPKLNESVGFRERVRAILMNQMAERPGSYIIIYAEPRERIPGLNEEVEHMSDMVNVLDFEDYSKEELMLILKRRLAKEQMKLTTTARQYIGNFIAALVATEERSHASSRLMRIVGDMIVRNCLQRIATKAKTGKTVTTDYISVQKQDVLMFTEEFVAKLMNERKRIGFV